MGAHVVVHGLLFVLAILVISEIHLSDNPNCRSFLKNKKIELSARTKKHITRFALLYLILFPNLIDSNQFSIDMFETIYYIGLAIFSGVFMALNSPISTYKKVFYITSFGSFVNIIYKTHSSIPMTTLVVGIICFMVAGLLKVIQDKQIVVNIIPTRFQFLVIPNQDENIKELENSSSQHK